ncbi:MAG: hypothetical protein AAFZ07_15885 [Actinomycetota bacterium]
MAVRDVFRRAVGKDADPDRAEIEERKAGDRAVDEQASDPDPTGHPEGKADATGREPTSSVAKAEQPEPAPAEPDTGKDSPASGDGEATVGSGHQHQADAADPEAGEDGAVAGDGAVADASHVDDETDVHSDVDDQVNVGEGNAHDGTVSAEADIDDSTNQPTGEEDVDHNDAAAGDVDVDAVGGDAGQIGDDILSEQTDDSGEDARFENPSHPDLETHVELSYEPPIVEPRTSIEVDLEPDFAIPTPVDDTVPSWADPPEHGPVDAAATIDPVLDPDVDLDGASRPFVPDVDLTEPEPVELPDIEPIEG